MRKNTTAWIACGFAAVGLMMLSTERAEAGHLFSQAGNPSVQINTGEIATFAVVTQGNSANLATRVDLFFDAADLFGSGDIIQFTLGAFSQIYDFDNPLNVGSVVCSGSIAGNFMRDCDAGSLLNHHVAGTMWSLAVLAGSVNLRGSQMSDAGGRFMQHGDDTHLGTAAISVPEPSSLALFGLGIGLLGIGSRRRKAK